MNAVFWILVIAAAGFIWVMLAGVFRVIGKVVCKRAEKIKNIIEDEGEEECQKEKDVLEQ